MSHSRLVMLSGPDRFGWPLCSSTALLALAASLVMMPLLASHHASAETRNAVVIDTANPLTAIDRARLADAGLTIGNLIDDNRYFGSVSSGSDEQAEDLFTTIVPGIEVDDVPRQVKLEPVLSQMDVNGSADPDGTIELLVRPSVGSDETDALAAVQELDPDARLASRRQAIAVTVPVDRLNDLADLDFVEQIEPSAGYPFLQ